jgi:hypothetical protein
MEVQLCSLSPSGLAEATFIINVSPHGARVLTERYWEPDERVLLKWVPGGLEWGAQVVYCERLPSDAFAIGLEGSLEVPALIIRIP